MFGQRRLAVSSENRSSSTSLWPSAMLRISFNRNHSQTVHRWARIGAADHCEVRLTSLKQSVAAVVVLYPTGWLIHPIKGDVELNGRLITDETPVVDAVTLKISGLSLRLFPQQTEALRPTVNRGTHLCRARHDRKGVTRTFDACWTLGRSRLTDFVCNGRELDAIHVLFACCGNQWYLHCLSDRACHVNGRAITTFIPLSGGDITVRLGSTSLTVTTEGRPAVTYGEADFEGPHFESLRESQSISRVRTLEFEANNLSRIHCDRLLLRMFCYLQAKAASSTEPTTRCPILRRLAISCRLRLIERRTKADTVFSALQQLEVLLQLDPCNADSILTVAGLCRRFGFDTRCFEFIRLGHSIHPQNVTFCRVLARICESFSSSDPRYLDQARGLWIRLAELLPAHRHAIQRHVESLEVRSWDVRRSEHSDSNLAANVESTPIVSSP